MVSTDYLGWTGEDLNEITTWRNTESGSYWHNISMCEPFGMKNFQSEKERLEKFKVKNNSKINYILGYLKLLLNKGYKQVNIIIPDIIPVVRFRWNQHNTDKQIYNEKRRRKRNEFLMLLNN